MAVENIIDAFYNACGEGNVATVQRHFCATNTTLNLQGMHSAISEQQLPVVVFLLPHMQQPFCGNFNKKVVLSNNIKLFELFYIHEHDEHKNRWMEQGIINAAHANCREIIDYCFEHVYSSQWWDNIRYTYWGGKVDAMKLGFDYLEEKVKIVQQRALLEQVVSEYGAPQARKL